MKKASVLIVLLILASISVLLLNKSDKQDQKPFIAVTSFTLYEISSKLLGDKIEVKKLIPFGSEMHTFRPSVKTMTTISKAKLFIFNGLGMEPWINKKYKNEMNIGKLINIIDYDDGHHHNKQGKDPHYWLDADNMFLMTHAISQRLIKEFPKYKNEIIYNEALLAQEYGSLDAQFSQALKKCKKREIIVNHNAFSYLGHKFDFHIHSVTGLSTDEQPSAKKMNEIAKLVKKDKIKYIFFESFVSPKISETIAKETGVKTLPLHTLANVTQQEAKKGYVSLMKENIKNIAIAMECE